MHVRYTIDGGDTSVSPRKHANAAEQGSNELISVLGAHPARRGPQRSRCRLATGLASRWRCGAAGERVPVVRRNTGGVLGDSRGYARAKSGFVLPIHLLANLPPFAVRKKFTLTPKTSTPKTSHQLHVAAIGIGGPGALYDRESDGSCATAFKTWVFLISSLRATLAPAFALGAAAVTVFATDMILPEEPRPERPS